MCLAAVFDLLMRHLAEVIPLWLVGYWQLLILLSIMYTIVYGYAILCYTSYCAVFWCLPGSKTGNLILHFLPKPNISSNLILQDSTRIMFAFVCLGLCQWRGCLVISKSATSELHCNAPRRSCVTKQDAATMGRIWSIRVATQQSLSVTAGVGAVAQTASAHAASCVRTLGSGPLS